MICSRVVIYRNGRAVERRGNMRMGWVVAGLFPESGIYDYIRGPGKTGRPFIFSCRSVVCEAGRLGMDALADAGSGMDERPDR